MTVFFVDGDIPKAADFNSFLTSAQGAASSANISAQAAAQSAAEAAGAVAGVTSVGLILPDDFVVTNSPVTSTGALTAARNSQAIKTFLAAPPDVAGVPAYRAIAATDVPTLNQNTTGTAAGLSVTLAVNKGGTGATTAQAAVNALTGVAGATNEFVLTKDTATGNAVFKAPAGGSGAGKKIVVLGDSLSYPGAERRLSWPALLEQSLQSMGSSVPVINLAVSGHSFYRVNTVTSFGTNTALQQCIALAPDLIIVMLGANDALIQVDGRSLAQVKADASTTISTLRSSLPSAKIIYVSELPYDSSKFSATSIKNKGVVPAFCSLNAGGILAGMYCPEMLNNYLDPAQQALFTNWGAFDTYLKALGFDGTVTANIFQIARLGCTMPDGLHPSSEGLMIIHAQILKGLSLLPAATAIIPQLPNFSNNITEGSLLTFGLFLTSSGDGYVSNVSASNGAAEKYALENVPVRTIDPDAWFYPYKTSLWATPLSGSINAKTPILFVLLNGPPNAQASLSVNGAAFGLISLATDPYGHLWFPNNYGLLGLPAGTHTLRYKVGTFASALMTIFVNA